MSNFYIFIQSFRSSKGDQYSVPSKIVFSLKFSLIEIGNRAYWLILQILCEYEVVFSHLLQASSRDPNHYGLTFPVSGTAMTDGGGVTGNYGSLFYAYDNNNQIFFWKPSSVMGCHTMIGGAWSDHLLDGTTDCSNLPNIDIRFLQATIDGMGGSLISNTFNMTII